jgi:hypothetical protein
MQFALATPTRALLLASQCFPQVRDRLRGVPAGHRRPCARDAACHTATYGNKFFNGTFFNGSSSNDCSSNNSSSRHTAMADANRSFEPDGPKKPLPAKP